MTNQHNMVYRSPFTLEKQTSCITQYYSISLSSDSLFEELIEGKYSLTSAQAYSLISPLSIICFSQ